MAAHGFSLALEKTEVFVLMKERVPTAFPIQVGEATVLSNLAVEYLGIITDRKMSFFMQIHNP